MNIKYVSAWQRILKHGTVCNIRILIHHHPVDSSNPITSTNDLGSDPNQPEEILFIVQWVALFVINYYLLPKLLHFTCLLNWNQLKYSSDACLEFIAISLFTSSHISLWSLKSTVESVNTWQEEIAFCTIIWLEMVSGYKLCEEHGT